MIDCIQFKANATYFRKRAKTLGIQCPLVTLINVYAYAHYAAPYNAVYSYILINDP